MYIQEKDNKYNHANVSVYPNPDAVIKLTQIKNRNEIKENYQSNKDKLQTKAEVPKETTTVFNEELLITLLILCNTKNSADVNLLLTALMLL